MDNRHFFTPLERHCAKVPLEVDQSPRKRLRRGSSDRGGDKGVYTAPEPASLRVLEDGVHAHSAREVDGVGGL